MLVSIGVFFALVLCSPTETAYADSNTEDVTELCRKYTNTISPNGIDFNQYKDTNQKIVLKNKSATSKEGQFKFDVKSVSTTAETVGLQSGKSSVVKFQPTETGIYKFAVNGAQIQDILTNQYNGELEHARTLNSSFVKSATMSIVCKKNASYYIIIKGDNTATSASVTASKDNASWSVGTNGSFVSGANIS